MSDYPTAWDTLTKAIGAAKGSKSGSIDDVEHLSVDQRIEVAKVAALLSISQELSALNPQNNSYRDHEGNSRNGWGLETHEDKPKRRPTRRINEG